MTRSLPLFVHSTIDDLTDLTPNAMRVYMHLTRRADADNVAWPSYQAIGDHCFKSVSDNPATRKSFARKAIDDLIEAGLVSKQAREREDGGQTSNGYALATIETTVPPMPIKHPPMPISMDVPISTPHAYKAPKITPIEDTPIDDEDNARKAHGSVFKAWSENIPGTMTPILGDKLHELIDECGPPAVIYGIVASVESGARNFKYIAACARNHAAGKEPPVKPPPRSPTNGHYANGTSKIARSLSALDDYEAIKLSHGVTT